MERADLVPVWYKNLTDLRSIRNISPEAAEEWVIGYCLRSPIKCVQCDEMKCYKLGLERYRCSRCLYTFRLFTGRWISRLHITAKNWLVILKCFEQGMGGQETAELANLSIPTIYRAFETIRMSLACQDAHWRSFVCALNYRHAWAWPGIFGIRKVGEQIRIEIIREGAHYLRPKNNSPTIVHRNGFVYTAEYAGYDALICHGRHPEVRGHWREGRKPPIAEPFLVFLKSQTVKHYGIPLEAFPLYLKELEFRFNHKRQSQFDLLLELVTGHIPRIIEGVSIV